ncbi:MAG: YdjY domain-containing protein [Puniceicoccaceae bacterium]
MTRFILLAGLALGLWPAAAEMPEEHRRYFDEDGRLRWVPPPEPTVERLAGGRIRIADLIVDPRKRSVLVPVAFNARPGEELEYLLVHELGKVHESLLRTETAPTYLHTAMLLLGVERSPKRESSPPAQIDREWLGRTDAPSGPAVRLQLLASREDGTSGTYALEAFVTDLSRDGPMEEGHWVYNGSALNEGVFVAEVEGSFASLITDPMALVNYTGPGRTDDLNWLARALPDDFPSGDPSLLLRLTLLE